MIPNVAIIPTRQRKDLCAKLVAELRRQDECQRIVVLDNTDDHSYPAPTHDDYMLSVLRCRGMSIYEMWNHGWRYALQYGREVNLAVLNDDIGIPASFIRRLAYYLRRVRGCAITYPDYNMRVSDDLGGPDETRPTVGTYKDGGMCGWAFMVRAELLNDGLAPIDESFEWWCGDDDLARNVYQMGMTQLRVLGLPVDHVGEASARHREELHMAKARDIKRWREKAGRF